MKRTTSTEAGRTVSSSTSLPPHPSKYDHSRAQPVEPSTPPVAEDGDSLVLFEKWTARYLTDPKPEWILDGKKLAQERRPVFKALIMENPRKAIQKAVPMVVRQKLPPEIVSLLEKRINDIGALRVFQGVPLNPDEPPVPTTREVELKSGGTYRAYVYGERANKVTWTAGAFVNGVAMDSEFAISDEPTRRLEVGERLPEGKTVVGECPVSGKYVLEPEDIPAEVPETLAAVETPTEIITFCDGSHIAIQNQTILYGEGVTGGSMAFSGILPSSPTPSLGQIKVLAMNVTYADQNAAPSTEAQLYATLRDVADHYAKASYGRLSLVGVVTPPIKLPHNEAWYVNRDTSNGGDIGGTGISHADARNEARKLGFDSNDYDCVVMRHNGGPGSYGGLAGGSTVWCRGDSVSLWAHEIGHTFGLAHSNFWDTAGTSSIGNGINDEYGDSFDVMGEASTPPGHYNAQAKNQIRWLPNAFIQPVIQSGLYRLYAFDQGALDASRRYALTIQKDSQRVYWGMVRSLFDSNPFAKNGLVFGWRFPNGNGNNFQLIDTTNGSPYGKTDSPVSLGATFSDIESGIHVTTVAANDVPRYLDLQVNFGNYPGNNAPELSLAASAEVVPLNGTVTFTATASDGDGDPLAFNWQHFGGSTQIVSPNSNVITRQFTTAGTYIVTCTVSDMKGGTTTRNKLITVGTATTFTISGRVTLQGQGLADVVVTANNANGVITDADGYFTIPNLAANTYTLTPLRYGYTFSELFNNSITVGPGFSGANFDASAQSVVTIAAVNANANELSPVTTGTFRITRTGDNSQNLVVNVNPATGSATKNTDYNFSPDYAAGSQGYSTFTIPADSDSLNVSVTPVVDTSSEGPETVILQLTPGNGYLVGGASTATVVIADDDTALPKAGISATTAAVAEGGTSPAVFTVSRTGSTTAALGVNYVVSGTATSGTDFSPLSGTVTIPAGSVSATIDVAAVNDTSSESLETVIVTLSTNAAYIIDPLATSGTVNLHDNDQQTLNVTASDAQAAEVDLTVPGAAANTGTFLITRDGDTTNALTVYYAFSGVNGSGVMALHGVDFEWMPGVIQIPAGQTSAAVTIVPRFDGLGEGTEQCVLTLGANATNYVLGTGSSATVIIADNAGDAPYLDVVNNVNAVEGTGTSANFRITVRGAVTGTTVPISLSLGGTADKLADYKITSWGAQASGITTSLRGVWIASSTSLWTVGDSGRILKGDGTTWVSQTSGTTSALRGIWGSSAASLWAVGDSGTIRRSTDGTTWSSQTSGTTNALRGIWGSSATSVWVVGSSGTIRRTTDGATWSSQTSGTTSALYAVWGTDANNVWAVGDAGTILKWNGTSWAAQTSGTTSNLRGVWGTSATNLWAVGTGGVILKGNGSTWTVQNSGVPQDLNGIWGADAGNVWICGASGLTLHSLDGSSWSSSRVTTNTPSFQAVSGSDADNVWVIGDSGNIYEARSVDTSGASAAATIPRDAPTLDLICWPVNDSSLEELESITITLSASPGYQTFGPSSSATSWLRDNDSTNTVYVDTQVGTGGGSTVTENAYQNSARFYISRTGSTAAPLTVNYTLGGTATAGVDYDNNAAYNMPASGTTATLRDVWGVNDSNIWAVGDGGVILKWNGSAWTAQSSGTSANLLRVWGADVNNVWAVGSSGTIRKWNGSTWSAQTSGTTSTLRSVWGTSATSVWAVGDSGTIRKWDGTSWATQTSGTTSTLNAVWAADASNAWVAGTSGLVRFWNGSSWASQTSATSQTLSALWGAGTGAVWAAGASGTIQKWNGTAWALQTLSGSTGTVAALSGTSSSNLAAVVGTGLAAFTTNGGGTPWLANALPPVQQTFNGVWRSAAGVIWAVGTSGTIVSWDWAPLTTFAGSATISAGSTGVDLNIRALEDALVEGTETITFDFAAGGYSRGPGAVMYVADNEAPSATVEFAAGSSADSESSGTVSIPVTLSSAQAAPVTVEYAVSGTNTPVASYPPVWVRLVKTGNTITHFTSIDGVTWLQQGGSFSVSGLASTSYLAGLAVGSGSSLQFINTTIDNFTVDGLSGGSKGAETVAALGNAYGGTHTFAGGVYSFNTTGTGATTLSTSDNLRFVYVPVSNSANCTVTARVLTLGSTNAAARVGVMLRSSTAQGSVYAATLLNGAAMNLLYTMNRTTTSGQSNNPAAIGTTQLPMWFRVTRTGDVFSTDFSRDNVTWFGTGPSQTIAFGPQVLAGIAVSSGSDGTLATATFDNVTLNGAPVTSLTGRTVGFVNEQGSDSLAADVWTLSGSGAGIGGTSDEGHFAAMPVSGDFTLIARVSALTVAGSAVSAQAGVMVRQAREGYARSVYAGSFNAQGIEQRARAQSVTSAFGAGVDYTLSPGVLTFAPGETIKNITLTVVNDSLDEPDNLVTIQLSNAAGAGIGTNAFHGHTILDDDNPPASPYAGFATAATTVAESAGTVEVQVSLSSSATSALSVNYSASGGTATGGGTDFTLAAGTLNFAPGDTVKFIPLTITDDATVDAGETVIITLASPAGAQLGSLQSHTVTITDNDLPVVTLVATDPNASEAGLDQGEFTFYRTGDTTGSLTVFYGVSGTASSSTDRQGVSTSVTFQPGFNFARRLVIPLDDAESEPLETTTLTITADAAYTVGTPSSATVFISDDDRSTVSIVASDSDASETAGNPGQFTVSRTAPTNVALTVNLTIAGTAANTADYSTVGTTVAFASGEASKVINITPVDDGNTEGPEEVMISLASGTYDVAAQSFDNVTIADNDNPPVVFINSPASQGPLVAAANGVILGAQVSDDGFPAALTTTWSCVSGPGTATIESPATTTTAVTFSSPGTYVLRITATDTQFTVNDQVTIVVGSGLVASNWITQDLGPSSARRGQGLEYAGQFSVTGTGAGYSNTSSDQAHVMVRAATGDGSVVARLTSFPTTAALAGVTIRDSLSRGSRRAVLGYVPGTGLQFRTRPGTGNDTVTSAAAPALPFWLKLERNATTNDISAFHAADVSGAPGTWMAVGTPVAIPLLNADAHYGLTTTNNSTAGSATALFDHVTLTPEPGGPALVNEDFGTAPDGAGSGSFDGITYTVAGPTTGYFYGWQYYGDFVLTTRLTSYSSGAGSSVGGLRITDGIEGGAYTHLGRKPTDAFNGYFWTSIAGGGGGGVPSGVTTGTWVRFVRRGNSITGYRATHNSTTNGPNAWTQIGQPQTIIMPVPVWAGFHVSNSSGAAGSLNTVSFSGLTIEPLHKAPVVSALASGATSPVTLDGTIIDDDLPAGFTSLWSLRSGTGITLGNPALIDTTATLTTSGPFSLRLTADDTGTKSFFDLDFTAWSTPFAQWLDQNNVGDGNNQSFEATADADGDGLVNLLEFAVGTNGVIQNSNPQVVTLAPVSTDKYLRITVPKNPAATDVTFIVEACSDLAGWSSAGLIIETNTSSQLVVRDTVPVGNGVQRFMRVRVTH